MIRQYRYAKILCISSLFWFIADNILNVCKYIHCELNLIVELAFLQYHYYFFRARPKFLITF